MYMYHTTTMIDLPQDHQAHKGISLETIEIPPLPADQNNAHDKGTRGNQSLPRAHAQGVK